MEKRIFVFEELCNGCKSCQMWCAFALKQEFNRVYSRIEIVRDPDGRSNTPVINCAGEECTMRNENGQPICVEMCPTGCLVYTDAKDASQKRLELDKSKAVQPVFKLIAPWKWPYPWRPLAKGGV